MHAGPSLFSDLPPESANGSSGQVLGKRESNDSQSNNENTKKAKLGMCNCASLLNYLYPSYCSMSAASPR